MTPSSPLCLVPVRGGSKGLPGKNLMDFSGVSLLEWTVQQAKRVYGASRTYVSTDDSAMAAVAHSCGVQVVERPPDLAQDNSTTASVVSHVLATVDPDESEYDSFTILQVTSPLRRILDVRRADVMMRTGDYDSVVSVYHDEGAYPGKLYQLEGQYAVSIAPELAFGRRQVQPKFYRRNGAIFCCTRAQHDRTGECWGGRTGVVEMPLRYSADIDTASDLELARSIIAEDFANASGEW